MNTVTIPPWNAQGVLPPINDAFPTSTDRSPYIVSLVELISRFTLSNERRKILEGFLSYRDLLQRNGYIQGFQWINGSFIEDIESLEDRAPKDIDVVTFFRSPSTISSLEDFDFQYLNPVTVKNNFHVDSFLIGLDELDAEMLTAQAAYWYSIWSHRRSKIWKGFLQIDLDPLEDKHAKTTLSKLQIVSRVTV